jgi:hypothetical protein
LGDAAPPGHWVIPPRVWKITGCIGCAADELEEDQANGRNQASYLKGDQRIKFAVPNLLDG